MDRELICLIVCFIVGIFLFYLLKQSCGCQVVEGNSDKLHWPRTCKAIIDIIGCDGLSSYPTTNKYFINCNPYCDSNVAPACPPPPTVPTPSPPISDGNIYDLITQYLDGSSYIRGKYGDISEWDTSEVTDMNGLFSVRSDPNYSNDRRDAYRRYPRTLMHLPKFDGNISCWNTSKVTNMSGMFDGADAFDRDISGWVTSKVTDMSNMFNGASSFNGDISKWNTSNVTDMRNMFNGASSFNRDISKWITSNVTNTSNMFQGASSMNESLKPSFETGV